MLSKAASSLPAILESPLCPVRTRAALARELRVTPQAVSAWVSGRALPSAARMARMEELLGIEMRDWTEPAPTHPEAS